MAEAERIAKEEFSSKRLLVISAVGTREYYQKLGYKIYGPYVSKELIWEKWLNIKLLAKEHGLTS